PTMRALRRLLPYYTPYRWQVFLGLAFVVISSAFASVTPWLLRAALDGIRAGAPARRIWTLAAAMVGLALVAGVLRYGMRELINGLSRRIEYDLRNDLFEHLLTLDAGYFGRTRTGDIMARLTNDLSAVRQAVGPAIMYLTNTIAGGVFALYFMLRIDQRLTLLALTPMVLLPVLTVWLGRAIHERFEAVQEHFSTMTTRAQENLAGARVVRAYRQERAELDRFAALNDEYLSKNMQLVRLYGIMNPAFGLLAGLGAVTVLGVGGTLAVRGTISVGAFVAFGLYLGMLTWPLIALGWVVNLFQRGAASMARLVEILDRAASVASPETPRVLPPAASGRSVEFRGVGFHYPAPADSAPRWVLRDVSFRVAAGETLAVVGATGSGKTALLELLERVYDPQEGEVLIDGVPVASLTLDQLRGEIGFVPQETLLFSETIRENLTYGTDDASRATWAAGVAQLDSTIDAFPGGYDTLLGERGINLSGGQKQRAALARALAREPSIVVLDDALSAVDTHTEADILRGLREALKGRTAIIASHRVSAVREATWIIVLDEGRIVEQGRHADLIGAGGRYWTLLRRQQLEDAIEDESGAAEGVAAG
ncbi:MAG TPA: ABC transporter ATP-binding protein, partial [Gemmatimonadaceae bacterium]|nr:ABC transporter ATP-binding protein [Gemmatimonadaceae bacterium]